MEENKFESELRFGGNPSSIGNCDSNRSSCSSVLDPLNTVPSLHVQSVNPNEVDIRKRCSTLSQPITIPGVANEVVRRVKQQKGQSVPLNGQNRRIQLVKCDDIIVHMDTDPLLSSPNVTSTSTSDRYLTLDDRAHSSGIGSAPADLMSEFIASPGQKIPRLSHYTIEDNTDVGNPAAVNFHPPQRDQALISFLQNFPCLNSELEQENAHFGICQAVICALEQIKWKKQLIRMRHSEESEPNEDHGNCDSSDQSIEPASAEWAREPNSAEGIALSLLSKFNDLPKATDIKWDGFVNDGPFPPNSCGDGCLGASMLIGTHDWAPPRPQIIFTQRGLTTNRKVLLQTQRSRCRGCGVYVAPEYTTTFRMCGYTGKLYCTACHRNQMSVIPARVMDDWDFKLYPVSVNAYRLIEEIWCSPLFNICAINQSLSSVSELSNALHLRGLLKVIADHVTVCRFYLQEASGIFDNVPEYVLSDLDLWAMADLKAIKKGTYNEYIEQLIQKCEDHTKNCELCLARGYLCEICHNSDIIFPWQSRTFRCGDCGGCFHVSCYLIYSKCAKCWRKQHRNSQVIF